MHAKYGIALLQMEITMAVLGDLGRYVPQALNERSRSQSTPFRDPW